MGDQQIHEGPASQTLHFIKAFTLAEIIGHFHPLLVHLPIGILVVALLLLVINARKKRPQLRAAISLSLFAGACSALLACVSGWFLSVSGEYEGKLVSDHQWMGITLALFSIVLYLLYLRFPHRFERSLTAYGTAGCIAFLLSVTGHLGGTLTHGEGYLAAGASRKSNKEKKNMEQSADYPAAPVAPAQPETIQRIRETGAIVMPIANGSNYLSVNLLSSKKWNDNTLRLLEPLSQQILWLKAGGTAITDRGLRSIAQLKQLRRLSLENNTIGDSALPLLASLDELQYLNLVQTQVTGAGLEKMQRPKKLRTLYLYRLGITEEEYRRLTSIFKGVRIDTGNYAVPTLATDTTELTAPAAKP